MNKSYHYYVKVRKPFDLKNNKYFNKIYNITEDDSFYYFYVNTYDKSIKDDINNEIIIKKISKFKFKFFFTRYIVSVIGFICFIIILILINNSVTSIKFNDDYLYDQEVYDYVYNHLDGNNFKFLSKKQINEINKNIRSRFSNFQWISISKKGTIIYIDISKINDDKRNVKSDTPGGLYAKYDAIVKGYVIESGTSLIKTNTSVNKDDELISGIINLYDDKKEYVHPEGYVIGEVSEYITTKVDKINEKTIRTGKFIKKRKIIFLNEVKNFEIKEFENYEIEYKTIFNFTKLFSIVDIYVYEIKEIINEYSLDDAYELVKRDIINKFNSQKQYVNEEILSIKKINGYLIGDIYYITYLVVSNKNICYFKEYNIN